jgi:hypothetical protein
VLPTAQPDGVATARDAEHRALSRDAVYRLVRVDGGVLQSSLFAKYAAVFSGIVTYSLLSASWRLNPALFENIRLNIKLKFSRPITIPL